MTRFYPHSLLLSTAALRVLIAVVAVVLSAWMQWLQPSSNSYFADEWLRDYFVRLHVSDEAERRIVVVDIDEASLATAGPWPWPRARLAALLESLLSDYGARGVALDMVLSERADSDGDLRLAMLAQHGPVVLAQAFDYSSRSAPLRVGALAGGAPVSGFPALVANGFVANHSGLAQATKVGNIGFVPDEDGMLRRLPMRTVFEGREYASSTWRFHRECPSTVAGWV